MRFLGKTIGIIVNLVRASGVKRMVENIGIIIMPSRLNSSPELQLPLGRPREVVFESEYASPYLILSICISTCIVHRPDMLYSANVVIRFPTVQQSDWFVTQTSKEVSVLHLSLVLHLSIYNRVYGGGMGRMRRESGLPKVRSHESIQMLSPVTAKVSTDLYGTDRTWPLASLPLTTPSHLTHSSIISSSSQISIHTSSST
jgi:hypothetical protein